MSIILVAKAFVFFFMPSISGRQCAVLRLLHGSLGCMASSHRSCWRFVQGHFRKPWLFWQKSRWSAHIIFVLGSGQRTMSTYFLVCGAIALYLEHFAWWSKAVLFVHGFPTILGWPSRIPKAAGPIQSAFGFGCTWWGKWWNCARIRKT